MFLRLLQESFARARRRKALAVVAVALGTAVATAMLAVALDVGDKMSREMRSFGANIEATPAADSLAIEVGGIDYRPVAEGAFIREADLPKLKGIFWRNAILAFAPFLYVPALAGNQSVVVVGAWMDREWQAGGGEKFRTGVRATNPTWQVEGAWPDDSASDQALAGRRLNLRPGQQLLVKSAAGEAERSLPLRITGALTTGGPEEDQLFVPLAIAQRLANAPGQVRKVQISALIKPDDDFARRDPATMTREEYDRWYCTPYIGSIVKQVQEALPGAVARQVRQIAQNEGEVLRKIQWLMLLVTVAALAASALAVSSATATVVIERRVEIALMKVLGSPEWLVAAFFLAEAALQGLLGGLAGYGAGILLAGYVGRAVFGAPVTTPPLLFPLTLSLALAVSLAGALVPLRAATATSPAVVLKEER